MASLAPLASKLPRSALGWLSLGLPAAGLSILVSMWLFLQFHLAEDRERTLAEARADAKDLAQAYEEHVGRGLQQIDQITQFIAYSVEQHGTALDLAVLFRQALIADAGFISISLADATGDIVATTFPRPPDAPRVNIADREHFQVHRNGRFGSLYVSEPVLGRLSGKWVVQLSRRLVDRSGEFAGVVVVATDPSYLTDFRNEQPEQQSLVSLVGLDGVVRAQQSGDRIWIGDAADYPEVAAQVERVRSGGFTGTSRLDGVRRILHYRALDAYPLYVVAGRAEGEVLAGYEQRKQVLLRFILFGTLVVTLMFGGLSLLLHRLRQRQAEVQGAQQAVQASERRLRAITDQIPALVAYIDSDQRYTFANPYFRTMLGVDPAAVLGRTVREFRGDTTYARLAPVVEAALRGERGSFEGQGHRGGRFFHYQAHFIPDFAADGRVQGCFTLTFDVTQLKESEKRLRDITDNLPVLIAYIDPEHRFTFGNATYRHWLGVEPDGLPGRHLREVLGPDAYAAREAQLGQALQGERVEFESESAVRTMQTSYIPDIAGDGTVRGVYALSTDVSAMKAVERDLLALARFDTLTGLANRHQFNEKLPQAMARAQRSGEALALLFLDVDHFKTVNDRYGHAMGDGVLREFAARLLQSVRTTDTVARLAGDEFVVILEGVHGDEEPQAVARKILVRIAGTFRVEGRDLTVSTSIGIALYHGEPIGTAELLAKADEALYAAKHAGRNTFHLA